MKKQAKYGATFVALVFYLFYPYCAIKCKMGIPCTSLRQNIKDIIGCDTYVAEYEEIKKSDRVNSAGLASYIERNQWMIDDSNFAFFRFGENV